MIDVPGSPRARFGAGESSLLEAAFVVGMRRREKSQEYFAEIG
jgi:hypothetical protein